MSQKKWQHIIPNGYLKVWKDINFKYKIPHVWVYDNKSFISEHKPTTNKIFTGKNFYTIYKNNITRDFEIEDAFARHEEDFYKIRDEKLFQNKDISTKEHSKICTFISIMLNRTEIGLDYIKNIFISINMDVDKSLIIRQNKELNDYDKIQQLIDKPVEYGLKLFIEELSPKLTLLDIRIYITTDKIGFIISDNPCVWHDKKTPLNHFGAGVKSEYLNIVLPISPNHCIIMKPKIDKKNIIWLSKY